MNNKVNPEKFRKLPITALVTGILTFVCAIPFMEIVEHFIGSSLDNFIPEELPFILILYFYVICLPIPAIVCGSIDLKRIRTGRYSNKGKSLDIAGIVLGSVFILLTVLLIIVVIFFSQ
ncbi:MAG: DUF4190 domain-containing protein [Nitrososphaeraceae archaeon]